jgi:hypothetical protein
MNDQPITLGEAEIAARKRRNLWIAAGLVGFIALIFAAMSPSGRSEAP